MTGDDCRLMLGDCIERMREIPDGSVDAIICDPPYPEISRPYGRMTEAEWWEMMMGVCRESRRVLTPKGSAVFVLQPNSRKVGSMRGWLWRFMAWACDEWNMVQDAWWWNIATLPSGGATTAGLLRGSLKACVWLGPPDCDRYQDEVLDRAEKPWMRRLWDRAQADERVDFPSGRDVNRAKCLATAERRGGTTPFNVLPMGNGSRHDMAGMHGHGAGTPSNLADWWVRYITRPGDTVLDMFAGSGTIPLAALKRGRKAIGIERDPGYFATMEQRIAEARASLPLFPASA